MRFAVDMPASPDRFADCIASARGLTHAGRDEARDNTDVRAELAAFGRANAYPPTTHWTSVLIEVMPETSEATPKGARWARKLQMS
jgi:hypothetical protein